MIMVLKGTVVENIIKFKCYCFHWSWGREGFQIFEVFLSWTHLSPTLAVPTCSSLKKVIHKIFDTERKWYNFCRHTTIIWQFNWHTWADDAPVWCYWPPVSWWNIWYRKPLWQMNWRTCAPVWCCWPPPTPGPQAGPPAWPWILVTM